MHPWTSCVLVFSKDNTRRIRQSLVMVSVKYTLPRQINYFIRGISRKGNTGPQWKYCGTCVERDHSRGQTGIGYMTTTYYCYDPNPPKSSLHLWPISLFPPPLGLPSSFPAPFSISILNQVTTIHSHSNSSWVLRYVALAPSLRGHRPSQSHIPPSEVAHLEIR